MQQKKIKLSADQIRELTPGLGACYATDRITVDGKLVGYMYREEPDNEQDSGWRFFSGNESEEYINDPENISIYDVNTIANYDRAIIVHLDAAPGTKLERVPGTDLFRKADE